MQALTRRRFITIAGAAGSGVLPAGSVGAAGSAVVTWRGTALGAAASMQLLSPDRAQGERLVARCVAEMRRLEAIFSLYRDDSALVALNRHGFLLAPPADLVALLLECRRYSAITDGAFDVTVQPLWNLFLQHFSRHDADPDGPGPDEIARTLAAIGYDGIRVGRDRISLARARMQVTLNGIAQGFITDRVVELLRAGGISRTLVDMGETRCLGSRPDGQPWQVGVADPQRPERIGDRFAIEDRAVATSGGYGFRFGSDERFNHLFDPRTGRSPDRFRSVTVVARTATAADALSTAFGNMTLDAIEAAARAEAVAQVRLVGPSGESRILAFAQ